VAKDLYETLLEKGAPEKEVKSKESCFLEISNTGPKLSLDSLIYDWDRTKRV